MEIKLHFSKKTYLLLLLMISFTISSYSQAEIASQRFHNGAPGYQVLITDRDATAIINTHVGADDWDYTAMSTNGQIRVVNSEVTTPASDLYCLEFLNYWDNVPSIEFDVIDIANFNDVTFSVAYHSKGNPDNNEDLYLEYSYSSNSGSTWTDVTVKLIDGAADLADTQAFGVAGAHANPYQLGVGVIPNTANAFKASIRAEFQNGADGSDNYYIDDVVLSGVANTAPPVAVCAADFSIDLDAFGNASITAADVDNGSYIQIVGTMILSIDQSTFTCADLGPNEVTLTVNDGTQSDTCSAIVTVNGYTGSLVTPAIPNKTAYCSFTAIPPADVSYQCNTITPTTTDPLTYDIPGNYSITWTYNDSVSGASETVDENITISALIAPSGIIATNIGAESATISWDEQLGVQSYEIQYKKSSLTNWDTVTSTTNTLDLTLLNQLTSYDVKVAAICDGSKIYSGVSNFTTIGHDYCVPSVPNFSNQNYINRVRFGTLTPSIDNTSTYTNGYDDYTATDSALLYKNNTFTITIDRHSNNAWEQMGYAIWIDFNGDGDFQDPDEDVWNYFDGDNTTDANTVTADILIPSSAVNGQTVMRVSTRRYWTPNNSCDGDFDGQRGEIEDYALNLQIQPDSPQDIDVTGNGNVVYDGAGVADLSIANNTNFGSFDILDTYLVKTFKITNNGGDPLTLTANPIVQCISNTGDFTITQPTIAVLPIGESTTFTVAFDPTTVGIKNATVQILNDDVDFGDTEDDFTFYIQGEGVQNFFDTDGDGITDNIDGDDDNDGILDSSEDDTCKLHSYASQVEIVFLNETFGSGYNRLAINQASSGSSTTYCYEEGTATCGGSTSLNDGSYALYYQASNGDGNNTTPIGDVSSWADRDWYSGLDHTPDSIDGAEPGRMLIVNADYDPGIFYEATITGVTPGVEVIYGFSVINLIKTSASGFSGKIKPRVAIAVYDPNGVQIAFETSSLIEPTDAANPDGDWVNLETSFISTSSQFTIQLINNQVGGDGNDLALDDIYVKQILCDLDGDGIADIIDLDNDNDGIPNVVELGLSDLDKDGTLLGSGWLDANANGVHDAYEGGANPVDTDGDGIPDYIDADSDNDGIFDAVEYDGLGDIDEDGDGLGDGDDVSSGIDDDGLDGDGILSIADTNDSDAGFLDHGNAGYLAALDTDNDGIPDYLEVDSNNDGVSDISETIYAHLDANNDGVIDGNTDVDLDGILDAFDTDNLSFGSPRALDSSYTLYFDGRNDYISENVPVIDAWSSGTLMAWIKIATGASGERRIVGQDNFHLTVNSDGTSSAVSGGTTITSSTVLPENIWVHVAASFNNADGNFVIYINGEQEDMASAGSMGPGTTDLTIGRKPGVSGEENVLTSAYFKGEIDEVRVFDAGLSEDEIQKMVYQELDDTNSFVKGEIIPLDISAIVGSSLQRYYKMDEFTADVTSEKKGVSVGAKLYNIKDIYFQTAPLPYVTSSDGLWTTQSTWLHGDVWDIANATSNKDWSIVHIKDDVTASHDMKNIGLIIDTDKILTVSGDHLVENSWYLELNGTLDLEGDSQLIQTEDSDLVTSATGKILRRQEGTSSAYWYNYWSSPVGALGATSLIDNNLSTNNPNNSPFSLNMLKDEVGFDTQFISGYTGNGNLSTYWLYTYINGITYWDWAHITTGTALEAGIGYTQKGTGTGALDQQYIFEGKPNNGTILVNVADVGGPGSEASVSKTSFLLGNPYPSALDVHQFIDDNEGVIEGSIQLWQQWSGSSHNLSEYNGGYAQVNKLGSIRASQFIGLDGVHTGGLEGTKLPTKHLPVGQGFIAEIMDDGVLPFDGTVEFNNGQRVFIKEADFNVGVEGDGSHDVGSVFSKSTKDKSSKEDVSKANNTADSMQKIRLEFNSVLGPETKHELLLGFSEFTTDAFDYGYDAISTKVNNNDLNLDLAGQNMNIQAYASISDEKVVPLNFTSSGDNSFEIRVTEVEDIEADQAIYLRDNLTGTYFNLREDTAYGFSSEQGIFNNRFEIVFQNEQQLLSAETATITENDMYYQNTNNTLFAKKLRSDISKLSVINMRGQAVLELIDVPRERLENGLQFNSMSTGAYVIWIRTDTNEVLTKKIIVK